MLLRVSVAACALVSGCGTFRPAPPAPPTPAELATLEARALRDSTNAEAQLRLAGAYLGLERAADALPAAERALARGGPTTSRAALLAGLAHEDLGHNREAREFYERALRSPGSARIRSQLQQRLVLLQRRETQAYVRDALEKEADLANTPPRPRTVAVFPLGVPAPDSITGPLGCALTAMLITDLSQTDRLTVLDRVMIRVLLDEIQLADSGYVDERTAARGGRILGAERIVQGSLASDEDQLRIEAAVVRSGLAPEAAEATDRRTVTEADRLDRLFAMEKRLALDLYDALGIELTPAERAEVTRVRTDNLQALLAWGRGLQALDAGDVPASARFFSEASRLDPGFAMAREGLAVTRAVSAAANVTTRQLAAAASDVATSAIAAWSTALPIAAMMRDAIAELLGTEGLSVKTAIDYLSRDSGGFK
jgi:TolB-like protein